MAIILVARLITWIPQLQVTLVFFGFQLIRLGNNYVGGPEFAP